MRLADSTGAFVYAQGDAESAKVGLAGGVGSAGALGSCARGSDMSPAPYKRPLISGT